MKRILSVVSLLLTGIALQPALADGNACLNPRFSYHAQPTGNHDVVAQNTIGSHTARVRITTSCIDLHNADIISFSTAFGCLGKGDGVVATGIDGRRQGCVITKVVPDAQPNSAAGP